jgi:hypothetical protein
MYAACVVYTALDIFVIPPAVNSGEKNTLDGTDCGTSSF